MNKDIKNMAQILNNRLKRIRHDYEHYSDYPLSEFIARESEINAIAYEIAELYEFDKSFDREEFMKLVGVA